MFAHMYYYYYYVLRALPTGKEMWAPPEEWAQWAVLRSWSCTDKIDRANLVSARRMPFSTVFVPQIIRKTNWPCLEDKLRGGWFWSVFQNWLMNGEDRFVFAGPSCSRIIWSSSTAFRTRSKKGARKEEHGCTALHRKLPLTIRNTEPCWLRICLLPMLWLRFLYMFPLG